MLLDSILADVCPLSIVVGVLMGEVWTYAGQQLLKLREQTAHFEARQFCFGPTLRCECSSIEQGAHSAFLILWYERTIM